MNNTKQMMLAWTLYATDNSDKIVYNRDGTAVGQAQGNEAWVSGWLDNTAGQPSGANTNVDMLINHDKYPYGAYLGPYIKNPAAFKCPADHSVGIFGSARVPRTSKRSLAHVDGAALDITVSVGVAAYPEHGCAGKQLVAAADAAMYRAKAGGRNRVEHAVTGGST